MSLLKALKPHSAIKKQQIISKTKNMGNKTNQPWFGKQCTEARKDFLKAKHWCNKVQNVENKSYLKTKGKKYKKLYINTILNILSQKQAT